MSLDNCIVALREIINKENEKIPLNKNQAEKNIENFKSIKKLFTSRFSGLLNDIESIPSTVVVKDDEEESPAAMRNQVVWEWEYLPGSKEFQRDGDVYRLGGQGYEAVYAYSSHTINEDTTLKVNFTECISFGCGGFGIMSKNDPDFEAKRFTSNSHLLFCLCCSGTWGAKAVTKESTKKAFQHILKENECKEITFFFDMSEMKLKIYDYTEELWGSFDINTMNYKEDLVLIFYTGSNVQHSHEIIPV